MGIPLYFRTITKQYPEVITKIIEHIDKTSGYVTNIPVDNLYLDMNCLIHPCSAKVLSKWKDKKITQEKLEKKIVESVKNYIKYLINFSKPQKLVYMAIDGPAPMAKMHQQRQRRFRSIQDKLKIKQIKKKLKHPEDLTTWNSNAITPGTSFLYQLGNTLETWIKTDPLFEGLTTIFSNANVPGEGEHKIFSYIRSANKLQSESHVIYGLDADLIMLSMASQAKYIYLLRESVHFGKINCDDLLYMDIPMFKDYFTEEVLSTKVDPSVFDLDKNRFINDYIVLCFFAGNDFLPHPLALHIGHKGIERLVNAYTRCLLSNKSYMVDIDKMTIDFNFIHKLIDILANDEDKTVSHFHKRYFGRRPFIPRKDTVLETEIMKHNMTPILTKNRRRNEIRAGEEGWRERYYWKIFHIEPNSKLEINQLCQEFYNGILWTFHYYFDHCISWTWYYPYPESPTLKNLKEYDVSNNFPKVDTFIESSPVHPLVQLMMVLPPQSSYLVPKTFSTYMHSIDSPILEFYPTQIQCISYYKKWYYESIPKLPSIDLEIVKDVLKDIPLSELENKRNSLGTEVVFAR